MTDSTDILHLTLHRRWFSLIQSGVKTEEYRERKPYWAARLEGRTYREVHFRNGHSKGMPFMRVEWLGCRDDAEFQGVPCYAIQLGRILEVANNDEIWAPLKRREGYEVSTWGRVRKLNKKSGEWEVLPLTVIEQERRVVVPIARSNQRGVASVSVAQLVMATFLNHGSTYGRPIFLNGDWRDVRLANIKVGRYAQGPALAEGEVAVIKAECLHIDKLTPGQRRLLGVSYANIAKKHNISITMLHNIRKGINWPEVEPVPLDTVPDPAANLDALIDQIDKPS